MDEPVDWKQTFFTGVARNWFEFLKRVAIVTALRIAGGRSELVYDAYLISVLFIGLPVVERVERFFHTIAPLSWKSLRSKRAWLSVLLAAATMAAVSGATYYLAERLSRALMPN